MHPLLHALLRPVDRDDPASVDPDVVRSLAGPFDRFGDRWYRLQMDGWENLPERPVLIVGNHNAGSAFLEALAAGAKVVRRGNDRLTGLAHDAIIDEAAATAAGLSATSPVELLEPHRTVLVVQKTELTKKPNILLLQIAQAHQEERAMQGKPKILLKKRSTNANAKNRKPKPKLRACLVLGRTLPTHLCISPRGRCAYR